MKYLKLFESISMKSYEEITDDEWSIFAHKWYESDPGENALTDKECQVIKDIINPYAYMKFDIKNQFISNYRYQLIILTDRRHIGDILTGIGPKVLTKKAIKINMWANGVAFIHLK